MAEPSPRADPHTLLIRDLQVYYGESHALQGVKLELPHGVLSVVGRNGMGKTTLCNAIMGLVSTRSGSIRYRDREIRHRAAPCHCQHGHRLRAAGPAHLAQPHR